MCPSPSPPQVYDDQELKLNDVVEVVGVLRCARGRAGLHERTPRPRWSGAAAAATTAATVSPTLLLCSTPAAAVPELAAAHMQQGQDGRATSMLLDDVLASHLPTSRAPRLHAILVKPGQAGGVLAPMLLGLQRSAQHVAQR